MMTNLKTELKKIKHRHFFPLISGCLLLIFLWQLWTLSRAGDTNRTCGYFSMLYQLPVLNTIILPLFTAVLASRIWDTEHKGNTFKLLYTLQERKSIYFSKSLLGLSFLLIIALGECVLICISGKIFMFTQTVPVKHIVLLFLATSVTSLLLYLLQEIITFMFENQIAALAIGLIGSFFGLFSLFFPRNFQQFIIWAYFSLLQTIGMNWDKSTREMSYYETPLSIPHLIVLCILIIIICLTGKILFERKEV